MKCGECRYFRRIKRTPQYGRCKLFVFSGEPDDISEYEPSCQMERYRRVTRDEIRRLRAELKELIQRMKDFSPVTIEYLDGGKMIVTLKRKEEK